MADLALAKSASSSRDKELPLDNPAEAGSTVFIPLEATVDKLKQIVYNKKGSATFIRAPVAAGKTTLAKYLAISHSDEFVLAEVDRREEDIRNNIIDAISNSLGKERLSTLTVKNSLKELAKANKTLILDEAHLIFAHSELIEDLFKLPQHWVGIPQPKVLLFSAAATTQDKDGNSYVTPSQISKKYMWYPPIPDGGQITEDLRSAEVYLTPESVDFFMKICSGHRGIFMAAMNWVQDCQGEEGVAEESTWDIHESVARVRQSFEVSRKEGNGGWNIGLRKFLKISRAVHVNGKFSEFSNIPEAFTEVLFGGSKSKKDLRGQDRELTVNGFLVPERSSADDEFVLYNWEDSTKLYGVANSLMAEYYGDILPGEIGCERHLTGGDPRSGADMVVRALPFMSFATVIDNPIPRKDGKLNTPLSQSSDKLPFEDDYNDAFAKILRDELHYTVSTPKGTTRGKTDFVVTYADNKTCALESIMTSVQDQVGILCF